MLTSLSLLTLGWFAACKSEPIDSSDSAQEPPCELEPGVICTWAGTGTAGFNGEGLHREDSWLYYPIDVEFSDYGLPTLLDWNNHKVRQLQDDQTLVTVIGTDFVGNGDPDFLDLTPEGADGTTVSLNHPTDVIFYPDGTLLLSSWHTHMLRTWDPETGKVHVVMGSLPDYAGDGETSDQVLLNQPSNSTYSESEDALYIVDMRNERVRRWDRSTDLVDTVAGNGEKGYSGDGGPATEASLNFPQAENPEVGGATALGPDGRLYIADTENHRIRVLDLSTGIIDTYAGTGTEGFSGDGGPASEADLCFPRDLEITPEGVMWIADEGNHRVRAIHMETGIIETYAGNGQMGYHGDGGPAVEAELNRPFGVEYDDQGRIYIADFSNHVIRVFQP